MKKIWFICIILTIFLISIVSVADRPNYYFGETVFEELPVFPTDFFEIKELLSIQKIYPHQLNESYYKQPEILPNWEYLAERYYNHTSNNIGQYGLGFYPSRFDVYDAENTTLRLSCLVFCCPGISKYQGAGFRAECKDKTVAVFLSDYNLLLEPTYPIFFSNWSTVLDITINVESKNNTIIKIFEQKPNNTLNQFWKNLYGAKYVTGASILGLRTPKLQVFLHDTTIYPTESEETQKSDMNTFVYIGIIIFVILLGGTLYVLRRRYKEIQD